MPRMVTLRGASRELVRVGVFTTPRPAWRALTLAAGCTATGSAASVPSYTKLDSGFAALRGELEIGAAFPRIVGTLPEGYRPRYSCVFLAPNLSGQLLPVSIGSDGVMVVTDPWMVAPVPVVITLDGIFFDVEI